MRLLVLIFITLSSFGFHAQEKRLALVIGNANYDKGALQNPVNDALLMKKTLESLDFDVILDTNISTLAAFNEVVRKFGEKRDEYNVGFIYYAGHGIQLNDVNYLLATKEEYKTEFDVEDKALSVQKIMRYLTSRTDEVNVLILDACRDNPFEQNWNPKARSTDGGRGLARIAPPTGSLVAYSTDAGNTAADGSGKNSIYCLSLTKNMIIENVTLDQVFRNVRADVLESSNGRQRPVEASQLTGEAFYLKKGKFTDQIIEIDSLIERDNYSLALELTTRILVLSPQNKDALLRKGRIQYNTVGKEYDGADLFKARELYPKDPEVYIYIARYYSTIGQPERGISEIEKAIKIDSSNADSYFWKARILAENLEKYEEAILALSSAIRLSPTDPKLYSKRGVIYEENIGDCKKALSDYSYAIKLSPNNTEYWFNRGLLYYICLDDNLKALNDFEEILKSEPNNVQAIYSIGKIYQEEEKTDLALQQFEKGIALTQSDPFFAASCYRAKADIHLEQGNTNEALKGYTMAIQLFPSNANYYYLRGTLYSDVLFDANNALIDFSKAIELDPEWINAYYARGGLYLDYLNEENKAIEDFEKILEIDPEDIDAINSIGLIYINQRNDSLAVEQYNKGIALEISNPFSAAYCYSNRADIYAKQGKLKEADKDFSKAIQLDPENSDRYINRGFFYLDYTEDFEKALIDFSKAIEIEPTSTDNWYNRGFLYSEYLNNDKLALEDFQKVLHIDPSNVNAINNIGKIYADQGNIDLAILQFEKGIELEKSAPLSAAFCYTNRGNMYRKQGKFDLVLNDYTKAIELDSKNPIRYLTRGYFYNEQLKQPYEALVDYSLALTLDSQDINPWLYRGLLFSNDLNDHHSAIKDFNQILKIDSNDVTVMNWIGVFYARLHDEKKEMEYYLKTIAKKDYAFEDSSDMHINGISYAYQNLAEIVQTTEERTKAHDYYSLAISFDKSNPEKYYYRAWFLASYLKKYEEAIKDMDIAVNFDNKNPKWYLHRAKINYLFGDQKSATRDFDKAVKLSLDDPFYIGERGNFYSMIGEYKKAEIDFNNALIKDSTIRFIHHYITENYIRQNMENEAIDYARSTAARFQQDTVSYEQLGRIYFKKKDLIKSLQAYQTASAIMDYNLEYRTIEPGTDQVYTSDVYEQMATIYGLLNEKDLQCEATQYAKKSLEIETRPDKTEMEKILQEKISEACK